MMKFSRLYTHSKTGTGYRDPTNMRWAALIRQEPYLRHNLVDDTGRPDPLGREDQFQVCGFCDFAILEVPDASDALAAYEPLTLTCSLDHTAVSSRARCGAWLSLTRVDPGALSAHELAECAAVKCATYLPG